jgi:5'-3' exonuclease
MLTPISVSRNYPGYKETRKKLEAQEDPEKRKAKTVCRNQIRQLRDDYLPKIGFCTHTAEGYEADDIIAVVCNNLPSGDQAIIISSDGDMYQLLNERVSVYSPHKRQFWTEKRFTAVYKIRPKTWVSVKALAGCLTDDVKGLPGVREKTALKYFRGDMNPKCETFKRIRSLEAFNLYQQNLPFVSLPYEGCPQYQPVLSGCNLQEWQQLCDRLGMKSLRERPPVRYVKR